MTRTVFAFGFIIVLLIFVLRSPAEGPIRLPNFNKVARSVASATTKVKVAAQEFKTKNKFKKSKKRTPSIPVQTTR